MTQQHIHRLFGRVASLHSARPAIQSGDKRVTYGKLEDRSNGLANSLIAAGARKGDIVAIFGDGPDLVTTAILGILKAGCVFVPLDPLLPEKRLRAMLSEAPPKWVVAGPQSLEQATSLAESVQPKANVFCVGQGALNGKNQSGIIYLDDETNGIETSAPDIESDPDDMCYLYFTSGSTGRPKGIAGRLKAIDHFIRWEIETFRITEQDRVSQLTSPSFDAYLRDIFVPLCSGATVCAPPSRGTILSSNELVHWLDREKISLVHCVPSLFRSVLNANLSPDRLQSLRYILMAGEPLLPADVEKWMEIFGERVQLVNLYGPSETTMVKLFYLVKRSDCHKERIPIGAPMDGAAAVVVSAKGRICPPGVVGELYIRTPFRTLGYFGQPELTREVFVPNPFNNDPEDIIYKTGDLCRMLEDGNFEFIGRKDHQVKIRGVRIELGEIEKLLRSHGAVRDAAVLDREDSSGNKYLCAYLVLSQEIDPNGLREYLADHLLEAMVPAFYVFLDELPRTISGKIDRRALPEPSQPRAAPGGIEAAPRNPVEEVLVSIWTRILGHREIGIHDNFFQLGGHSLLATQLLAEVRTSLGVEVPLRCLFESPTIAGLSKNVESIIHEGHEGQHTKVPPLCSVGRDIELPLSFAQRRLWFLDQVEGGSAFYNICGAVCLSGRLNVQLLERTLFEIVRRHEILRTTFKAIDGLPRQVVAAPGPVPLVKNDLSALSESERDAETKRVMSAEIQRSFDLSEGPLFRVHLIRFEEEEHVVLLTIHHIISDGWSVGLFIKEVLTIYDAYCAGKESPLPELPVQYADFAVWQQQWLQGELIEKELAYWTRQLAGAPRLTLRSKRPASANPSFKGAQSIYSLPDELTAGLKLLSTRASASLFMTLLAAYSVLLHCYSGQEDLVIGAPVANRDPRETETLIGLFINLLVFRIDLGGDPSFRDLLDRVREVTLDAYTHQNLPFEKLVEHLRPERVPGENPLFQVSFTLDNTPESELELPGLSFSNQDLTVETAQYDLVLHVMHKAGRLFGVLQYKTDLFGQDVLRMPRDFELILQQVVARPEVRVKELRDSLSQSDKQHWIEEERQLEAVSLRRLKTVALRSVLRTPTPISPQNLIRAETLYAGNPLPLVMQPRLKGVDLPSWARANRELIESSLFEHGAILFRNFDIRQVEDFESFIRVISDEPLEYMERSSPRRLISGKIYTSTDYPKQYRIFPHNENSYQRTWPLKLFFFCLRPPLEGGETLITNCRRVLERIAPQIKSGFEAKQWKYIRNFGDGFGLDWPEVFQTTDKTAVEEHCRANGIAVEWKQRDRLKISAVRPAFARHPRTRERLWFNHATFFHFTTLEPAVRDELLLHFEPGDMPTNSYYGDDSPIEAPVLEHFREAYLEETISFPWQAGDLLLLDNMLTAHGRAPYSGSRSIGVGMAELTTDTQD